MEYKDFFEYDDIQVEGKTRIGASSLNNFYNNPKYFYEQTVLGKKGVTNTNMVLGTIIHSRISAYWTGIPIDEEVEDRYLDRFKENPEVNDWEVIDKLHSLWDIIPEHISQMPKPTSVEQRAVFEIPNSDYILGGTYDYYREEDKVLGDIKTTATTPKSIKYSHWLQLVVYELCRRMNGLDPVDKIEVLYIVKTKQPKIITLQEPIDEKCIKMVKEEIKLMVKRLDMAKQNPEFVDLLFFHNRDSYLK